MALRNTTAKGLDKFIEDHLRPDTSFRTEVRQAINMICAFLKERCFRGAPHPVRVSKVVKGGSSGKGTTLRGRSDADLVVFFTNLHSFQEQVSYRGEFIREIRRQLEDYQTHNSKDMFHVIFKVQNPKWSNPRVLSFELSSRWIPGRTVEFDVLPAYDVLGQVNITKAYTPNPQIYEKLIDECTLTQTEGEFSTCFTELQKAFVKGQPTKVKSLIRLVKHWYQLCKQNLGGPLPPQYALELLRIYAWESGSGKTSFNTAQGFRTVLELVIEHEQLCIYWTEFYDFKNPTVGDYLCKQLRKPRPVILDPADPTGNLGGKNSERWQWLAQEAEAWLSYPCFTLWDGSSVNSWDLPELLSRSTMTREIGTYSEARPWKTAAHHEGAWVTRPQAGTRGNPEPAFPQHTSAPTAQETWSCTLL